MLYFYQEVSVLRWIASLLVVIVIALTGGSNVVAPLQAMPLITQSPGAGSKDLEESHYYTVNKLQSDIAHLTAEYTDLQVRVLGRSYFGEGIVALTLGRGSKVLMVTAGMHGWEWIGSYLVMRDVKNLLKWENASSFLDDYTIVILPMINPDGVRIAQGERLPLMGNYPQAELASWKANAWGVDINRNFPHGFAEMSINLPVHPGPRLHPGRGPASERETQVVMRAVETYKPDMLVDLHSSGNIVFWHYNQVQHLERDREVAHLVAEYLGYGVSNDLNQAIGAHLKDYVIGTYEKPAMIVEIGSYQNRLQIHREFDDLHERFDGLLFYLCTIMP